MMKRENSHYVHHSLAHHHAINHPLQGKRTLMMWMGVHGYPRRLRPGRGAEYTVMFHAKVIEESVTPHPHPPPPVMDG